MLNNKDHNSSIVRTTKLLKVLAALDKKEYKNVVKFLRSPFFNKDKDLEKIFNFITKKNQNFTEEKLDKSKIHAEIFSTKMKDNFKAVNKKFYSLATLLEKYMSVQETLDSPVQSQLNLMQSYGKRNAIERFEYNINDLEKTLHEILENEKQQNDHDYYYHLLKLKIIHYEHPMRAIEKLTDDALQKILQSIQKYYVSITLKYQCEFINWERLKRGKENYTLPTSIDWLTTTVKKLSADDFFQRLLNLYQQNDLSTCEELFSYLKENLSCFEKNYQNEFLRYLMNFTYYKYKQNDEQAAEYLQILIKINQLQFSTDNVLYHGQITMGNFLNYVRIAAHAKEFASIETFISKYLPYVDEINRYFVESMAWEAYYFHKKEYLKALEMTNRIQNLPGDNRSFLKLVARSYKLRIIYEVQIANKNNPELDFDFEEIQKAVNSFKTWLIDRATKDLNNLQVEPYRNYCTIVSQMSRIWTENDAIDKKINKIKITLKSFEKVAQLTWLKKKITELETKFLK